MFVSKSVDAVAALSSNYTELVSMMERSIRSTEQLIGSEIDEIVAIVGVTFSSVALAVTFGVVLFVFLKGALFSSFLYFGLLLATVLENGLLLVFSVLALIGKGSVVFDRILPVLVTLLEILSILLLLRNYLDAVLGEIMSVFFVPFLRFVDSSFFFQTKQTEQQTDFCRVCSVGGRNVRTCRSCWLGSRIHCRACIVWRFGRRFCCRFVRSVRRIRLAGHHGAVCVLCLGLVASASNERSNAVSDSKSVQARGRGDRTHWLIGVRVLFCSASDSHV